MHAGQEISREGSERSGSGPYGIEQGIVCSQSKRLLWGGQSGSYAEQWIAHVRSKELLTKGQCRGHMGSSGNCSQGVSVYLLGPKIIVYVVYI